MGDKSGWIAHLQAYMISGSLRSDFPSITDGANKKSGPIHPFGHHKCIPRSPTGSVCSPSTRPNLPSLTRDQWSARNSSRPSKPATLTTGVNGPEDATMTRTS